MLQLSFVNIKAGNYLLVEGRENCDRFYIIQSGNVRCFKSNSPETSGRKLGPGDFVGVISCMSGHAQIENVEALTDVKCISVLKDQYSDLIAANTPIALKIIRTFATRMRMMNEELMKYSLRTVSQDTPEHIYDVACCYDKKEEVSIASYAYYRYVKECPNGLHRNEALKKFSAYRTISKAVFLEPTPDLTRIYPKGTMIMSESQSGAEMFVIQEGQVAISKVVDGEEVVLAVLHKGDMFGEMALLENKPRSASAIANEACRLMVVNRQNFDQMVTSQPQLISRLTVTLSERLWSMYRQLDNALLHKPLYKAIDMLALQLEKARVTSGQYQTELTIHDLLNMCAVPDGQKSEVISQIQTEIKLKQVEGKIFIPHSEEIINLAIFYRKKNAKEMRS